MDNYNYNPNEIAAQLRFDWLRWLMKRPDFSQAFMIALACGLRGRYSRKDLAATTEATRRYMRVNVLPVLRREYTQQRKQGKQCRKRNKRPAAATPK